MFWRSFLANDNLEVFPLWSLSSAYRGVKTTQTAICPAGERCNIFCDI
ncbi:unnamed protein product [Staurois parvus]|uniref:Uncharacterized protein n=1 Tax=Staurois parvus TaxID=386267 RepID=A0ABN9DAT2_9NEOB|nr:unnamed protein product [Staurois parvus]